MLKKDRGPGPVSAAARTVDMFTGQTNAELAQSKDCDIESTTPATESSPRIEDNIDRYRARSFECQEAVSKGFGSATEQGVYRLSIKDGWMFLEQLRLGRDGEAFHWAGVMFPKSDLHEITNVFVRMCKMEASK